MGYYADHVPRRRRSSRGRRFEIAPQVRAGERRRRTSPPPGCRRHSQTREAGADIVNIAQVFERSGTLQVSFADNGIDVAGRLRGQEVIGNWGFGNEYEVFAALGAAGLDPATDVELVGQQFDMVASARR